jgi:hypothetical protein
MGVNVIAKKALVEVREEAERVPNIEIELTDREIECIELKGNLEEAEQAITDNEIAIAELQERMDQNA